MNKQWNELRNSGLLWWINRQLHLFGWTIVYEFDDEGKLEDVYPSKVSYRGFHREAEEKGFANLTKHLADNAPELLKAFEEDS